MRFIANKKHYVLEGKIGDGAVGLVRKATQVESGERCAVKFLAPDPKYIQEETFEDVKSRFLREGKRGAALDHPHLLDIQAYEENENAAAFEKKAGCPANPFIVMEYVAGDTLEAYIRRMDGPNDFVITKEKLELAIRVADAIKFLHQSKIVHRDVKPANIFLTEKFFQDRNLKLGDFGITKWGDFHSSVSSGTLTMTHQKGLGTLKYMAPEQAVDPKDITVKADIFAFGITLFELFTGQILAGPHNVFEIILHRLNRGTTIGRYANMGLNVSMQDSAVAEMILEMLLRGSNGRPTIDNVRGTLAFTLNQHNSE